MTVFREVARKVINDIVHATSEASSLADTSTTTKFFNLVGLPRDLALSKIKRDLIVSLLPEVDTLVNEKGSSNDSAMCARLQILITKCKTDAATAATVSRQNSGSTELALDSLIILLQSIFDKLAELKLLDIPHDDDSLNIWRYYVALYYAQKIAANRDPSLWGHIVAYPNLASKIELTEKQDALLIESFKTCTNDISIIDKFAPKKDDLDYAKYQEMRRSHVYLSVYKLQQENKEICDAYTPTALLAFLDPNDRILVKCLETTIEELEPLVLKPASTVEEGVPAVEPGATSDQVVLTVPEAIAVPSTLSLKPELTVVPEPVSDNAKPVAQLYPSLSLFSTPADEIPKAAKVPEAHIEVTPTKPAVVTSLTKTQRKKQAQEEAAAVEAQQRSGIAMSK